jgi:hypothetical protein
MNRDKATGRRARVMRFHTESERLLLLFISHSSNGFFSVAQQPNLNLGRLNVEVSRSPTATQTPGRTPLNEWSSRCRRHYHTTHHKHKRRTFMPSAGFEPAITTIERPQTYVLDLHGCWDRPIKYLSSLNLLEEKSNSGFRS